MKISACCMSVAVTFVALMSPVSSGLAADAPGISPGSKDMQIQKLPVISRKPDLAVIDMFFDAQCQLKYTVENKGSKIDPLPQYGMGVKICGKDNQCLSNVQMLNNLADGGSQSTLTCVPAKPVLTPPYTITILPPIEENKLNNSLTKDIKCLKVFPDPLQ